MDDPIWNKVHELTKGYPPEFNAGAVAELVEKAWRMGFNLVVDPTAPQLYSEAIAERNRQMGQANLAQAHYQQNALRGLNDQ